MDFFYYSTLEICISISLASPFLYVTETINDKFDTGLTIAFIVMEVAFLVFLFCFYYWPGDKVKRMNKYKEKVGALYEGLNYEEVPSARLVTVFFILKRVGFVLTTFYMRYELLQIFLIIEFLNLVYLFSV